MDLQDGPGIDSDLCAGGSERSISETSDADSSSKSLRSTSTIDLSRSVGSISIQM